MVRRRGEDSERIMRERGQRKSCKREKLKVQRGDERRVKSQNKEEGDASFCQLFSPLA